MADSTLLDTLRRLVEANTSEDDLLLVYLDAAKSAILNRLYPMEDSAKEVPARYSSRLVEIAAYLYNKRGAEGETLHVENGISRSYEGGSIPNSMLADIIPYGSVI